MNELHSHQATPQPSSWERLEAKLDADANSSRGTRRLMPWAWSAAAAAAAIVLVFALRPTTSDDPMLTVESQPVASHAPTTPAHDPVQDISTQVEHESEIIPRVETQKPQQSVALAMVQMFEIKGRAMPTWDTRSPMPAERSMRVPTLSTASFKSTSRSDDSERMQNLLAHADVAMSALEKGWQAYKRQPIGVRKPAGINATVKIKLTPEQLQILRDYNLVSLK